MPSTGAGIRAWPSFEFLHGILCQYATYLTLASISQSGNSMLCRREQIIRYSVFHFVFRGIIGNNHLVVFYHGSLNYGFQVAGQTTVALCNRLFSNPAIFSSSHGSRFKDVKLNIA